MPRKKKKNLVSAGDITINDCANAVKPVRRIKKSIGGTTVASESDILKSWDQIDEDEFDIIEEVDEEGNKKLVYKKKRNRLKSEFDYVENRPGTVYPEIVWYLISKFIKPEDIGNFAGINKATYAMTKRESFWRDLYSNYCEKHSKLPERLKLEYSYKFYGLRQRVIRALYHTYDVFVKKVVAQSVHDSKPHDLVKRRCVNVWYNKGSSHWLVYFKFKKLYPLKHVETKLDTNIIEELSRIEANPEEDSKVLQITCQNLHEIPPLMGMTLSSVSVVLSQGFRHHRLHLGFNSGSHNISRDILPECSLVIDTVVNIVIYDWWHPKYPHFDNKLPSFMIDDEVSPVLQKDFFKSCDVET